MRSEGELTRHLPPAKRYACLDADAIQRLVKLGLTAASMERHRGGWRLWITLDRSSASVARRSVVISGDSVGNLAGV